VISLTASLSIALEDSKTPSSIWRQEGDMARTPLGSIFKLVLAMAITILAIMTFAALPSFEDEPAPRSTIIGPDLWKVGN
jgi:hypothetical protein